MSGLLEADIDLGLESGAAAFDPFSRFSATTITTATTTTFNVGTTTGTIATRTARFHHQQRIHLSRAPLKVHVRFICLTSSHHGFQLLVSLPRERASGDPLFAFSFRVSRSSPSPCTFPLSHPSFSLRSSILGASFCLALSIPRASLPRQVPGLCLLTLFPARTCRYPSSSLAFRLRRVLPLSFSSKFVSDGGRSFTLPTLIRRFHVSHPWVPATAPRSIHSPVRSDDTSSTPREFPGGWERAPHRTASHRDARRSADITRASPPTNSRDTRGSEKRDGSSF